MNIQRAISQSKLLILLAAILAIPACSLVEDFSAGPDERRPMRGKVECFQSVSAAKRALHSEGKPKRSDYQWHHIVNQNPLNKARFGEHDLHCSNNLVYIPRDKHRLISAHYQRKTSQSKRKRVYEWLAEKSFERQYSYGLELLRRHGISFRDHGVDP